MRSIALLPGKENVTPEMALRMNMDLCFDHSDATRDFGFSPRGFHLNGETCKDEPVMSHMAGVAGTGKEDATKPDENSNADSRVRRDMLRVTNDESNSLRKMKLK